MKLSMSDFRLAVKNTSIFTIDLILKNSLQKILLGLRKNPPAKGYWFVPGGRVYKNENLNEAFIRILNEETGLSIEDVNNVKLIGVFEHKYEDNFFGDPSFNAHYTVLACEINLRNSVTIRPDPQHEILQFFYNMTFGHLQTILT